MAGFTGDDDRDRTADAVRVIRAHRYRRFVVQSLGDRSRPVHAADLARDVARRDAGDSDGQFDEAESVYVDLYHRHLPKLHDVGVVRFDPADRTASLTADPERIERALERLETPVITDAES